MIAEYAFLLLSFVPFSYQVESYCYAEDENPYVYFSSATSYSTVRSMKFENAKNCEPIYTWSLIRHGTSYMSENQIQNIEKLFAVRNDILKNHAENRGKLCQKDLIKLQNWNLELDKSKADQLVAPGMIDLKQLAKRLKNTLSAIFKSNSKESFEFQSSSSYVCKDSASTFAGEILQINSKDIKENVVPVNSMLEEDNENIDYDATELQEFISSDITMQVVRDITSRLGFENILSFETLISIYQVCAYENAWGTDPTPAFCAAFLPDELKMIEYATDLRHYYEFGYGNKKNENFGIPLIKDMLTKIINAAEVNPNSKKGTFYFTDSSPISAVIKKLNVYHDEQPLKHDNYETMKEGRKWRSSSINCFASNIIAVVYKCSDDERKVGFYHNENLLELPSCGDKFCSMEVMKEHYKRLLENEKPSNTDPKNDDKKDNEPQPGNPDKKPNVEPDNKPQPNNPKENPNKVEPKNDEKKDDKPQPKDTENKGADPSKQSQNSAYITNVINLGVLLISTFVVFTEL